MAVRGAEIQANVLAVMRRKGRALSAYDILDELRASAPKLAPQTIYRALAVLTEHGKVHRVESRNAFVACSDAHAHTVSVMSVCNDCGLVEENAAPDLMDQLSGLVAKSGFVPDRHVIEVLGSCSSCASEGVNS